MSLFTLLWNSSIKVILIVYSYNSRKRKRPEAKLSAEQVEARALLQKEWTKYKREEYISNVAQIDRIMGAQRRALDRLYEVSEDLYNEAIMVRTRKKKKNSTVELKFSDFTKY